MIVHNGHGVPSRFVVRAARAALLPPPAAAATAMSGGAGRTGEEKGPAAVEHGARYALLIDRGDRHSSTERRARTLTNDAPVRREIEADSGCSSARIVDCTLVVVRFLQAENALIQPGWQTGFGKLRTCFAGIKFRLCRDRKG